jgi:hypothetical protein
LVSLEHESGVTLGLVVCYLYSNFFVSKGFVGCATLLECVVILPVSHALGSALTLFLEVGPAGIDLGEVINLFQSHHGFGISKVFGEEFEAPFFLLDSCLVFCF